MKPHLPVSLFRALIAAAIAFPMFVFGGDSDVPDGYSKFIAETANQVTGNASKMAFLLKPSSLTTVSNPTMSWGSSAPLIFNSSDIDVLLTSWDNNNLCSVDMSFGQHLMTVGDLTFVSLYNISLDSNKYGISPESTTTLFGGALASGTLTHDDNGNLEGYSVPTGEILFRGNRNIDLTRNELSLKVNNSTLPVEAYGFGGVIMAPTTTITGNKDVILDANTLRIEAGSRNGCYAVAKGGLIYGSSISILNNENVSIKGNRLDMTSSGDGVALGAAMFSNNTITIAGNNSVTIRDNAVHFNTKNPTTELFYLQSIVIDSENQGQLSLSAGSNCGITVYDPIVVDCNVSINDTFVNTAGNEEMAVGNVIFSSKFAEDDLTAYIKGIRGAGNETPSVLELMLSKTSIVAGTTTLHAGTMQLCDGITYAGNGFVARSGSTLFMRSSTLLGEIPEEMTGSSIIPDHLLIPHGNSQTIFETGSNLYLKSVGSTINSAATIFEGNNLITFDISATNLTGASITIADDLTFNSGTRIYITSDNQLTEGIYELINMPDDVEIIGWASANITVSSNDDIGFKATYANLRWEKDENGINHLFYYTTMPPLLDAVWSNGDGDGIWSSEAINWEQLGQAYAFSNGATATFNDTGHSGKGTDKIYLKGELRPSEVLVDNTIDAPYEWVAAPSGGKLSGDMILTKRGTGSLKISLANTYTGGTIAEAGSLIAGHAQAFGTGDITVKGGNLDLQDFAVTNSVLLNFGSFSGTAYAGELTVNGTATIGDNTTAVSVTLESAVISGGSFTNTDITSKNSSIDTLLSGKTNLTSLSNTTLKGNHTSTGVFTVVEGTFYLQGSATADWDLKGGSLSTEDKITLVAGQDFNFNGGNLLGSLATSDGSGITTSQSSAIAGSLELNGGTFTPGGDGVTLKVSGDLSILQSTEVNVNAYENSGIYVLAEANGISGDTALLTPKTDTRNENTIYANGSSLMLEVTENPATLYWSPGSTGQWQQLGDTVWIPEDATDDPKFYNRDTVVFNRGGTAKIVGEVRPAAVIVEGDEDVSLGGSGSIIGKTSIVKRGESTLNMNEVNTYEGGTTIEGGTVNAGGAQSFGSGAIHLQSGLANMGNYAVKNEVIASGGKFIGRYYAGTMTVQGDIILGDDTTAEKINISSGSIKEGSIEDADIIAQGPALIESGLKGNTSITVENSETILNCDNSSIGGINVNGGLLRIGREEALGSGDIYLNSGNMQAAEGVAMILSGKQKLHFRGGNVAGNVITGNSSAIVVDSDATIDGNLTLKGGTIYFNGRGETDTPASRSMIVSSNGSTLYISGSLTLASDTLIQLEKGQYADGDILVEAASLTNDDISKLILNYDDGNPNTEYTLALHETDGKVQLMLDLDKVYEHTDGQWTISNGDLRDLLVQNNWGIFAASHAFTDAMQGQRSAAGIVGSKGVMVWASGLYSHMSIDDDGTGNGSDSDTMGAAVGIETMVGSRSCIGLAVGVTSTDISVGNVADEMEQDGTYVGIYGATVLNRQNGISGLTLSWSAAYGSTDSSPSGAASSIEWQQDSFQLNARLDWSRTINDYTTVNLFAGLEYFMTTSDTVAGIDSGEISNLRAELGAGITRRYSASVLYAEARLLGDIMRDDPTPTINGWSAEGANPGSVGAGFRVGAAYDINQFWSVGANGNVEIMGGAVNAGANVGVSLRF